MLQGQLNVAHRQSTWHTGEAVVLYRVYFGELPQARRTLGRLPCDDARRHSG